MRIGDSCGWINDVDLPKHRVGQCRSRQGKNRRPGRRGASDGPCNVEIECRPIRIVSLELNGAKFVARRVRRQVNSEIGRGSSRKSRWKSAAKRESGRKRKVGQIEGSGAEVRNGEGLAWRRAPNCDTAKVPGCRAIG